jgi:hypothetical protein
MARAAQPPISGEGRIGGEWRQGAAVKDEGAHLVGLSHDVSLVDGFQ